MTLAALRGALGFLTRLPVSHDGDSWTAFRRTPWTFPAAGYVVGVLVAAPLALTAAGLPDETVAAGYLVAVLAVTGINHLDGVADVGDAAVVHGDASDRRDVLKDTTVGVGAAAAVGLTVVALAFGALGVLGLPVRLAVGVAVAAEVGAKAGMAVVACLGTATHEGLGSSFTARATPRDLVWVGVVTAPAAALAWPTPAATGALVGAVVASLATLAWLRRLLGGVNGDVFGAVNEVGRVVGLHAGVIAWTLS